jgi:hypothetical protein
VCVFSNGLYFFSEFVSDFGVRILDLLADC